MCEVEFSLKVQSDADVLLTCDKHTKMCHEQMTNPLVSAVDPDTGTTRQQRQQAN